MNKASLCSIIISKSSLICIWRVLDMWDIKITSKSSPLVRYSLYFVENSSVFATMCVKIFKESSLQYQVQFISIFSIFVKICGMGGDTATVMATAYIVGVYSGTTDSDVIYINGTTPVSSYITEAFIIYLILLVSGFIVHLICLLGAEKKNKFLLIPFLCYSFVELILYLMGFGYIIYLVSPVSKVVWFSDGIYLVFSVTFLLETVIGAIWKSYFCFIVIKYYREISFSDLQISTEQV